MNAAVAPALEQFRRQWQEELQVRRQRDQAHHPHPQQHPQHPSSSSSHLQFRSFNTLPLGVAEVSVASGGPVEAAEEGRPCAVSVLPDELLLRALSFLGAASLCAASRVCRHWHGASRDPRLWRALCARQWPEDHQLGPALVSLYRGSWFRMRSRRPSLRLDGVYCAKVSYVRRGVAEWTFNTPVQTVVYYRYLR